MGVIVCDRCGNAFKGLQYFDSHKNSKIPCDLHCIDCGRTFSSRRVFSNHNCKIEVYDTLEDAHKSRKHKNRKNSTAVNTNVDNTNVQQANNIVGDRNSMSIDNSTNNNVNINVCFEKKDMEYIIEKGMVPHDTILNQELLYEKHKLALTSMISDYVVKNYGEYSNDSKYKMLIDIAELFYANNKTPHYLSIYDNDASTNHNQVFSGKAFITDILSKDKRNNRVFHIIYNNLNRLVMQIDTPNIVKYYIRDHFLPYLTDLYTDSKYKDGMQELWKQNKQKVEFLQNAISGGIPKSTYNDDLDSQEQLLHYIQEDRLLLKRQYAMRMRELEKEEQTLKASLNQNVLNNKRF